MSAAAKVTWSKEQRARAKTDGKGLIVIGVDGRIYFGPADKKTRDQIVRFITKLIKSKRV